MLTSPGDMIAWYRRWPSWAKVLGFAFFAVFFIGGTVLWLILRDRTEEDTKVHVDAYNDLTNDQIQQQQDAVAEIEAERAALRAEDQRIRTAMISDEEERRALRKEITNARDAAELDALYERLRAAAKRRNSTD